MRNPIHKRLEHFSTWQHHTFMVSLCERMYPNFYFFCQLNENLMLAKTYRNILNLVWEHLTVKNAKINFDNQLEKLEAIIPSAEQSENYAVFPAIDACEGLANLLHSLVGSECLEQSIALSQLSLKTIIELLEEQNGEVLNEQMLKTEPMIENELDIQWQLYRVLKAAEKHDIRLILDLKEELQEAKISNIGLEM